MPPDRPDRTERIPASPAGRVLDGRYRLVERIDAGGAGEVWRARDERLERDVAVKILGRDADEAFRERFTQEARRAAAIAHPNVVTVFDEGRDGEDAYMVMEHVRGRTLRDVVADRGPLPEHEAARLVAQVAAALDAAHAAGVIHCDVKPANVIVDDQGRAKLTDFGVARAARGAEEHELIGTPRYIAPERIEGKAPTARSDVYSLALVAYELLAGQPAYAGVDTEELLRLRLEGRPPSLRTARVGVPPEADKVIARALARDPADRFASAGSFARALDLALEHGDPTRPLAAPYGARPLPRRSVRLPALDSTLALLAVILVVLAVVTFFLNFPDGFPGGTDAGTTPTPTAAANVTPDVRGMDVRDAANTLIRAGFESPVPWRIDPEGEGEPCTVIEQEPEPGERFEDGDEASLVLAPGGNCAGGRGRGGDD